VLRFVHVFFYEHIAELSTSQSWLGLQKQLRGVYKFINLLLYRKSEEEYDANNPFVTSFDCGDRLLDGAN